MLVDLMESEAAHNALTNNGFVSMLLLQAR
jgi:hypothetical protein